MDNNNNDDDDGNINNEEDDHEQNNNKDDDDDDYNDPFFQQILGDIGRLAFGVIFMEVWILNDDKTQLIRGGIWIDPVVLHDYDNDSGSN